MNYAIWVHFHSRKFNLNLQRYRTLIVLGAAQSFGQTASPILVLLGGIVGVQIAPDPSWSTLPLAIMIVGIACAAVPASFLMASIGRKAGFLIGSAIGFVAALIAVWSIENASFGVFCLASFLIGNHGAFIQQFRFAVAESVEADEVPKSLSLLMLAGIVAAIVGPEVGRRFSHTESLPDYVGAFYGMAILMAISFSILLAFYRNQQVVAVTREEETRALPEILKQPTLILAITSAVVGYTVMSLVMTATPVSMHEMDQHSLDDTAWVVQSHILAMYIPSLFSGFLIGRFGVMRIIQSGFIIMVACVAIGWGKPMLMHYWWFHGVAWDWLELPLSGWNHVADTELSVIGALQGAGG